VRRDGNCGTIIESHKMSELNLIEDADKRGRAYLETLNTRRVFPDASSLAALSQFAEALPEIGFAPRETLALLDDIGSPATVVTNGPNYYGFVIGASLPVAAAAERMMLAWDQCASSFDNSPIAATLEKIAAGWMLDILDLPSESAVGFGTSATACGIACLSAARRQLLKNIGWDFDGDGLAGAPPIKVIVPASVHITVKKALRLMGVGLNHIIYAPVDGSGRIDPSQLPTLDAQTILCLQAGEVNTGAHDFYAQIIPHAKAAGAWVHVDGAFGLWARACPDVATMTAGVDQADSWTVDGHKWLNTPYDGAMAICRDAEALASAMNADAVYATAARDAQKNLTLEFSRRARGIPIWAALRSLGRKGVADMIAQHCRQAKRLADGLRSAGYEIVNDVTLNQVLVRAGSDAETVRIKDAAQASGALWFGPTVWQGRPAFRMSVCSWRTQDRDIDRAIKFMANLFHT
jgi:glutamate/tyrosine decarboxylase-like PLP-dependent enzyme